MRKGFRSRPIGWIAAFGTLAAATLVIAAPSGAAGEKTYEVSFEASCVLAPGVLNQKGVIKVHVRGNAPPTVERGQQFFLSSFQLDLTMPKEWAEPFFSLGSRSVKGDLLSFVLDAANAEPAKLNIAGPLTGPREGVRPLAIRAPIEDRETEIIAPPGEETFDAGPWRVTGHTGEEVSLGVDSSPGIKETSSGHFESTGEGILIEVTGYNELGEADVGPVQTACTAPEHLIVAAIPINGESSSTTTATTTTATTTTTTTPRCPGGPDCGGPLNDKLTGSVTVHKLRQSITLPEGCTFRGIGEIPGPFEANTKCPPFTATFKLFGGLIRTTLGLNVVESEPVKGKFAVEENPSPPGPAIIHMTGTARDNIEVTSVGLFGLTIPVSCKTAEPVVFAIDSKRTAEELLTIGATSSGETTLPAVQCGGPLGGIVGSLFTALMSGANNAYTLTIAP